MKMDNVVGIYRRMFIFQDGWQNYYWLDIRDFEEDQGTFASVEECEFQIDQYIKRMDGFLFK